VKPQRVAAGKPGRNSGRKQNATKTESKNIKPAKNKRHGNWTEKHPTGIKPSVVELTQRVQQVANLLCDGYKNGEIAEKMHKDFKVSSRTTETYISRAKALILEEVGRPKDEHRAESFGYYQKMSHDKEAPASVRLHARELIGDLLGLDAPKRAEISGPDGGPIATKEENPLKGLPVERLRELAAGHVNGEETNQPANGR
jgi:hypothetical protein